MQVQISEVASVNQLRKVRTGLSAPILLLPFLLFQLKLPLFYNKKSHNCSAPPQTKSYIQTIFSPICIQIHLSRMGRQDYLPVLQENIIPYTMFFISISWILSYYRQFCHKKIETQPPPCLKLLSFLYLFSRNSCQHCR